MHVRVCILMFVERLCRLISLIYIHLLCENINSGKGQKCAGGAIIGG